MDANSRSGEPLVPVADMHPSSQSRAVFVSPADSAESLPALFGVDRDGKAKPTPTKQPPQQCSAKFGPKFVDCVVCMSFCWESCMLITCMWHLLATCA